MGALEWNHHAGGFLTRWCGDLPVGGLSVRANDGRRACGDSEGEDEAFHIQEFDDFKEAVSGGRNLLWISGASRGAVEQLDSRRCGDSSSVRGFSNETNVSRAD